MGNSVGYGNELLLGLCCTPIRQSHGLYAVAGRTLYRTVLHRISPGNVLEASFGDGCVLWFVGGVGVYLQRIPALSSWVSSLQNSNGVQCLDLSVGFRRRNHGHGPGDLFD